MPKTDKTLLEFMDACPPALVRIAATEFRKRFKDGECRKKLKPFPAIIADSGLSRRAVQRLATKKTWEGVKVGVASAFIKGCGFDLLHNHRPKNSISKTTTRYYFYRNYIEKNLPHLSERQRERFLELMGWNKEAK